MRRRFTPGEERRLSRTAPSARWAVFLVALAVPLYLGMRGGGYDIVVRQGAGLVLWWGLALGYLFGFLPRARPPRAALLPLVAVAGLVAWTALSLTWTESRELTFAELARTLDYAGLVVLAYSALDRTTWRSAAAGLSAGLLLLPVVSVLSRIDPGAFPTDVAAQAFPGGRLGYPLGYWNAIGAWGAMAIAVGLAWSAHVRRGWLRELSLAAVPVAGAATYLSYSRTAIAGSALAIALAIGLARHRLTAAIHALAAAAGTGIVILVIRSQPAIADATGGAGGAWVGLAVAVAAAGCAATARQTARRGVDRLSMDARRARPALVAGLAAVLVAAVLLGPGAASRASHQFTHETQPPVPTSDPSARLVSLSGSRFEIWSSALGAFGSDPLKGIGPGTFQFWWARDSDTGEQLLDAHSLPLETMAELGVPGIALLLSFIGGAVVLAVRAWRGADRSLDAGAAAAMIGAFLVYLLHASVDWMWELPAVSATGIAAVAIARAGTCAPARRRRRLTMSRLVIAALALIAGAVQVPGLASTDRLRTSQRALAVGDDGTAIRFANDAVGAEPWAASPYAGRSFVELERGDEAAARDDAREAIAHEPTNWRYRLLLGRIEAQAGNATAALRATRQARDLGAPQVSVGPALRDLRAGLNRP